jgi:hypothetical protein
MQGLQQQHVTRIPFSQLSVACSTAISSTSQTCRVVHDWQSMMAVQKSTPGLEGDGDAGLGEPPSRLFSRFPVHATSSGVNKEPSRHPKINWLT